MSSKLTREQQGSLMRDSEHVFNPDQTSGFLHDVGSDGNVALSFDNVLYTTFQPVAQARNEDGTCEVQYSH